ncbi:MAG: hypothetical protein ACU0DW_10600 [Shimia sp.]
MKPMLTGFAAIVVIAVLAYVALNGAGFSSSDVFSGDNVRLE